VARPRARRGRTILDHGRTGRSLGGEEGEFEAADEDSELQPETELTADGCERLTSKLATRIEGFKDTIEAERRKRYVIQRFDTLASIASKKLGDVCLATLIFEINDKIIPYMHRNGKTYLSLRPGLVIWLPTSQEIREFRSRPFSMFVPEFEYTGMFKSPQEELAAILGDNWDGTRSDGSLPRLEAADKLSETPAREPRVDVSSKEADVQGVSEAQDGEPQIVPQEACPDLDAFKARMLDIDLGTRRRTRLRYIVRLGDTLRSIASKHPALGDAALWELVARVNDITTGADASKEMRAPLPRGTTIWIPSAEEVAEFRIFRRTQD
jgi:nucleoid-associated protein YgaU